MQTLISKIFTYPSLLLLIVQLLSLVINPLLQATKVDQAIFNIINLLALSLAVWVVNRSPIINWVAWLFAVPAVLFTRVYVVTGNGTYLLWAQSLESIMYLYTAVGLVLYMFNDHIITRDELFLRYWPGVSRWRIQSASKFTPEVSRV